MVMKTDIMLARNPSTSTIRSMPLPDSRSVRTANATQLPMSVAINKRSEHAWRELMGGGRSPGASMFMMRWGTGLQGFTYSPGLQRPFLAPASAAATASTLPTCLEHRYLYRLPRRI